MRIGETEIWRGVFGEQRGGKRSLEEAMGVSGNRREGREAEMKRQGEGSGE